MKQLRFDFLYLLPYDWLLVQERKNFVHELHGLLHMEGAVVATYDMPRFQLFVVEENYCD